MKRVSNATTKVLLGTFLLLFAVRALAAIPGSLSYQGYLSDASGAPLDTTVSITFRLYDVSAGGTPVWQDTQSVTVNQGLFTVELGNPGNPLPPAIFDNPLWLGVEVASDGEMVPRKALTSVAFAFHAQIADDATTLQGLTAAQLDQSAHVIDTTNPHGVTAAQLGALTSGDLTTHAGDASAHHAKTTSFTELSDAVADGQIPTNITRDAEVLPWVLLGDGPGSTLNADFLDGNDSTAFAAATHSHDSNYVSLSGDTMTGALGIGTAPAGDLQVLGQSGILFEGTYSPTGTTPPPASGAGSRMMWMPEKSAFRAGYVSDTQWDAGNIGLLSIAVGGNVTASGSVSTATGSGTTASGSGATATGVGTTASGDYSTAMGLGTSASGHYSTALAEQTTASGHGSLAAGGYTAATGSYSTAFGYETTAPSTSETVIGRFNTSYTPVGGGVGNDGADRLFVVGNGTSSAARSDAMVVLKNGRVGIGDSSPGYTLSVSSGNSAAPLAVHTTNGFAYMGAQNANYFHFYTDMPAFYFNKQVQCNGGCVSYSDLSKKQAIEPVGAALDKVSRLEGVTWTWKDESLSRQRQMGLIAQNVEAVAPELVEDTANGKTMNYDGLSALTVEAIKELNLEKDAEIAELTGRMQVQTVEISALRQENAALQRQLQQLAARIETLAQSLVAGQVAQGDSE